jgi:hypothetical protein
VRPASKKSIICLGTIRLRSTLVVILLTNKSDRECRNDLLANLVSHRKNIVESPVVTFRPDVTACGRIDQLGVNSYLVARALYTSFHHIAHTKFLGDLTDLHCFILISEH